MYLPKTTAFLKQLSLNNNRDWFNENKSVFNQAKAEFESYIDQLIAKVAMFDSSIKDITAKDCVFRIYKDTRFSKDKTPYKNHFGAYIADGGRKGNHGGYYIHIEPDNSFVAGGLHQIESPNLLKIRSALHSDASNYLKILASSDFKKYFAEIKGDKLKTAPKGFPRDAENIELLKLKAHYVIHNLSDKQLQQGNLEELILNAFKAMYPLNTYLKNLISK